MKIVHTGPETYEQFVELGLDVQPVHAGMSRFAKPDEAWDLWWRPEGWGGWRLLSVGQEVEIEELTG